MEKTQVWEAVLNRLSEKISRMEFGTWFRKVDLVEISGNAALVGCPTEMNKNWLENKYYGVILTNLKAVLPEIEKLYFQVELGLADKNNKYAHVFETKGPRKLPNQPQVRLPEGVESRVVQSKFTLQNFIVGPENQFAHAACVAIAEGKLSDPCKYNPLYIYGGVGLGKTHLLQGTANEISKRNPGSVILYTTAERFTNEMIKAIKDRKTEELRKKFRKADVLLIDDVQFLSGKERTQVELFNTFNDLRDQEKQIIFSADRPPSQLNDVVDRLSSRMSWGLVVDVDLPSFETKVAIVQDKCKELGIILTEDVQHFIATNIRKNLRELENVLNKIAMEIELNDISPTVQSVGKIFRKLNPDQGLETALGQNTSLAKNPDDIITSISEYFQIPATDLLGTSRKQEVVLPRQICWILCKDILKMSFEAIGEAFGGKNHTTIMHGIKKIQDLIRTDSTTARHIHALKQELGVK